MRSNKPWLATVLALGLGLLGGTSRAGAETISQPPAPRHEIQGLVTTPEGAPVVGASVAARRVASRFLEQSRWLRGEPFEPIVAQGQTGADGRYQLSVPWMGSAAGVSEVGVFEVSIHHDGHLPLVTTAILDLSQDSRTSTSTLPTATLVLDLGATVDIAAVDAARDAGPIQGTSSKEGRGDLWLLTKAREGTPGLGSGWRPHRPPTPVTGSSIHLPRAEGETLRVDLVTPGAAVLDRGTTQGRLRLTARAEQVERRIRVVDSQGRPQASILLTDRRGPVPLGVTDPQGWASLRLPAILGLLRLEALSADGAVRQTHLPTFSADQPMTPEERETVSTLQLEPVRWFEGQVLDPADRPVAGAWVLSDRDSGHVLRAGRDGRIRVPTPPPGSRFRIGAPGHVETRFSVNGQQGKTVVVRLESATVRRGRVVDGRGRSLAGVLVSATIPPTRRDGSEVEILTTSNAQGAFAVGGLPRAQRVRIRTEHPKWSTSSRWSSPGATPLELVLSPRRAGSGRVVDLDERPVAGARVELRPETSQRPPQVVTTDGEGRWRVPELPEGAVDLEVSAREFAPFVARGIEIALVDPLGEMGEPGSAPARAGDALSAASISSGADISVVDLGTVVLEPGRRLEGRVLDPEGAAVAGAKVRLGAPGVEGGRETSTDARGRFEFLGLPATTATLRVHAAGYAPARLPGVPVPSERSPTIRLGRAASVLGRVVDAAGAPIAGAEVEIRGRTQAGHHGERRASASLRASAVSRVDGRFVFDSLPTGPAKVVATASGYQEKAVPVVLEAEAVPAEVELVLTEGLKVPGQVRTHAGRPLPEARVVLGDRGTTTDLEGRFELDGLTPGAVELLVDDPLTGRTRFDVTLAAGMEPLDLVVSDGHGLRGVVLDGSGRGIGAASVRVLARERGDRTVTRLKTEPDGRFETQGLGVGAYRLVAEHPDHGFADLEVELDPLAPAGRGEDLRLVLEPTSTLAGDLLGLEADELATVAVQARHPDLGRVEGRVDYAGRYRFSSLPAGPWHLTARVPGTGRFAESRLVLRSGEDGRQDLEFEGSSLTGVARFLGEPIAGASLDLRGLDSAVERRTLSDPDGRFELLDLAPGRYRVSVVSRRLAVTYHRDVELLGDLEVELDVEPVALEGQVVDDAGEPIVEALLRLEHRPEQGPSGSVLSLATDAEGLFRIDHLPPGRHHLQVRRLGFEPLEQTVDLGPEPVETLYLPMTPSPGLHLRVGAPPSQRPRWLTVALLGPTGGAQPVEAQLLDSAGEARFDSLPPGDLRLLVRLPGTVATEVQATVPGPPVDVELHPAAAVDVWVSELAESDRRAWLSIQGVDGRPFATLDDRGLWRQQWPVAAGRAAVEGLPGGLWTVRIEASDGRTWQQQVESVPGDRFRLQL